MLDKLKEYILEEKKISIVKLSEEQLPGRGHRLNLEMKKDDKKKKKKRLIHNKCISIQPPQLAKLRSTQRKLFFYYDSSDTCLGQIKMTDQRSSPVHKVIKNTQYSTDVTHSLAF